MPGQDSHLSVIRREGDEPRSAEYDAGWNDCAAHSVKVIERLEARLATARGAVEDFERVGKLAAWLIRDRREFDKVTAYAGELEALARRHGGSRP